MNKLVRDKIPEIIIESGKQCNTRTLTDEEYEYHLKRKLLEEAEEFCNEPTVEEAADVLEVLYALTHLLGITMSEIVEARLYKKWERGGFKNKVYLMGKD